MCGTANKVHETQHVQERFGEIKHPLNQFLGFIHFMLVRNTDWQTDLNDTKYLKECNWEESIKMTHGKNANRIL